MVPENSGSRIFIFGMILASLIFGGIWALTPNEKEGYFKDPPEMKYFKEGKLLKADLQKNTKIEEFLPQGSHLYLISMEDKEYKQTYYFNFFTVLSGDPKQYLGKRISVQYYHPQVKAKYRPAFWAKMLLEDFDIFSTAFFMEGDVIYTNMAPLSWAEITPPNKGQKNYIQ